jgi:outer membrane protein OmpA-like peptidoglycan-associated protein
MYKLIKVISILVYLYTLLFAKEPQVFNREIIAFHPKVGYILNFFQSDFSQFPPIVDCGNFNNGFGTGIAPSLSVEIPVIKYSHISIGLGYFNRSGFFRRNDENSIRDMVNPPYNVIPVQLENTVEAKLEYLEMQVDFRTILVEKLINGPLRGYSGIRAGYSYKDYIYQTETITSPTEAVFVIDENTLSKKRNIAEGNIYNIYKLTFGVTAGIENLLYIGRGNYLSQAISFDYFLNPVAKDVAWNYYGVRFDLGLRYNFRKSIDRIAPLQPPSPVLPEPTDKEPIAKAKAPELDIQILNPQFRILTGNELLATLPLVNAVFFDNGSSSIPQKYKTDSIGIPEFFIGNAVDVHSWVLPRIAAIVNKNPAALITIEGATSGKYEIGGISLAMKRADAVKKILIKLGVSAIRIKVKANLKPRFESNEAFEAGYTENQRADIIIKNAPLQEYVALQKFAELTGKYQVKTDFRNTTPDSGYIFLNTKIPAKSVKLDESGNISEILLEKFRINPDMENLEIKASINYMECEKSDSLVLPVSSIPREMIDLDLSKFIAVIRFDYNSSVLSDDNKGLLRQMAEFLPRGSTITISGSTDALGTEERNTILAKERADNTLNYIKSVSDGKFSFDWQTDNNDKFIELTPEGRFLNRNIKVRVRK